MLVHVTRFIAVQEQVADMLGEGLSELQRRIRYERDDSRNGIHAELHDLWESDFVPTTNRVVELDWVARGQSRTQRGCPEDSDQEDQRFSWRHTGLLGLPGRA